MDIRHYDTRLNRTSYKTVLLQHIFYETYTGIHVTCYFILFHLLCAQHVSNINISIFRSLDILMSETC